jgi:tripartite-type tricarboxylate transporter receptor subunit TctC
VQMRLAELSAEPVGGTPQETANYLKQESERWRAVITAAHVTLD